MEILKESGDGYFLINKEVLVGPIKIKRKIGVYYNRNKELYGELDLIFKDKEGNINKLKVFGDLFNYIEKVFDKPLVSRKKQEISNG